MSQEPEEERVIKSQEELECGCFVTHYEEGPPSLFPCIAHALENAASMLSAAAQRFHNANAATRELKAARESQAQKDRDNADQIIQRPRILRPPL